MNKTRICRVHIFRANFVSKARPIFYDRNYFDIRESFIRKAVSNLLCTFFTDTLISKRIRGKVSSVLPLQCVQCYACTSVECSFVTSIHFTYLHQLSRAVAGWLADTVSMKSGCMRCSGAPYTLNMDSFFIRAQCTSISRSRKKKPEKWDNYHIFLQYVQHVSFLLKAKIEVKTGKIVLCVPHSMHYLCKASSCQSKSVT